MKTSEQLETGLPEDEMLATRSLAKTFRLHTQGGAELPVFTNIDLSVGKGDCLVLHGPSGAGKSTLMRLLYANYLAEAGEILVRHQGRTVNLAGAEPHTVLEVRKWTLGYVSQFLRVIPRVSAVDVVAEPLRTQGVPADEAATRAEAMLTRLNIPERLWSLAPATFSGGEQQRINLARGFVADYPVLLLDEPTASLDQENRTVVVDLIQDAKARGTAVVGIFHDADVRDQVGTSVFTMPSAAEAA